MLVDAVLQRKLFVNVSSSDSSAGEDDEGGLSRDQVRRLRKHLRILSRSYKSVDPVC